ERLEAMTRWSAYLVLALGPYMAWALVDGEAGAVVLLVLVVLHALVAAGTLRASLDTTLGRRGVPRGWFLALAGTSSVTLGVAFASFPGPPARSSSSSRSRCTSSSRWRLPRSPRSWRGNASRP